MPMVVMMQLAKLRAHKSVGEKASPLPWLSVGASVMMLLPLCKWVFWVRKSPRYRVSNPVIGAKFGKKHQRSNVMLPVCTLRILSVPISSILQAYTPEGAGLPM